jgi:hypothetical protein
MGKKFLEYEVVSPVEVVYPEDFLNVAENIGRRVFSEATRSEIRMWSTGATFSASKSNYNSVPQDKLRYYHYSKVSENLGTISLDYLNLVAHLNTAYLEQNYIGAENLADTIRERLSEKTGLCTLDASVHEFDYIDVIEAEKRESTKLFVLKQFLNRGPKNPLEVVTKTATDRIEAASQGLHQVDFNVLSELTDSIVFGWVENNPSDEQLEEFKETLTERFKDKGTIQARVTGLHINTAL